MGLENTIGEELFNRIKEFVDEKKREFSGIPLDFTLNMPEVPRDASFGELFTDIPFKLAPYLKKKPEEVAEELAKYTEDFGAEPTKGFVNYKIPVERSIPILLKYRGPNIMRGKRVLCEFVSANPTGPLHIGHGRIAAVGNAIANIIEFCGGEVEREFYINDAGEQIEKLGISILGYGEEYKGEYTDKIRKILESKGLEGLKLKGDAFSFYEIGFRASLIILEDIKETLRRFGISFDRFVSEREISQKYLQEAKNAVADFLYEKEGAIFMRTTDFGDEKDRVFIKSDGKPTYFGNDCAYHLHKVKRGYDILVEVWGADHHGYVKRIEAFLKAVGFKGEFKVKLTQMVNLIKDGKPVQMSKREGIFISLDELIDEVSPDAAKFIYLTRNCDSHLDFDLDLARKKSMDNPVYYVQYTHARICSLFREAQKGKIEGYERWKRKLIEDGGGIKVDEQERSILGLCAAFSDQVITSCKLYEPSKITSFLLTLASKYHSFYQRKRVLVDDEDVRFVRLFVSDVVRDTVRRGLSILGVSAPERM